MHLEGASRVPPHASLSRVLPPLRRGVCVTPLFFGCFLTSQICQLFFSLLRLRLPSLCLSASSVSFLAEQKTETERDGERFGPQSPPPPGFPVLSVSGRAEGETYGAAAALMMVSFFRNSLAVTGTADGHP